MALKIHQLGYLSDTTCWSVCQVAALQDRDPSIIDDGLEYVFIKDKLVRLWLAQDFAAADGESHVEDIACKYFDDLVESKNRSKSCNSQFQTKIE
ncbi:hypothetical protein E2562_038950 [Oryza meyeriana var. granulata]|uniref:Disease resistance protein winged helix domain-containing protein n=1 Tax=Oryza meyeriana var. granulata TaxID=110450 RepID=A0A6G1C3L4_9ORYZ|nr:hypothetical protein E2562_038950 [Oryza meyeriana var. granulata]